MRTSGAAAPAIALAAFLALAGCGTQATQAPATGSLSTPPPTAAAPTTRPSSNTTGCADAAIAVIVAHLASRSDVVRVSAEGGCQEALVETSLPASDVSTGLVICDAVAEVAYGDEISSIRVLAADAKELAFGIEGSPCIGEQ